MATGRHVENFSSKTLASAAANGDKTEVLVAIQHGADVNQRSGDGMVPLCIAAFWGYAEIAETLLKHGADVNATNSGTKWTAAHCAAFQGHGKVLMRLMEYRPNLTLRDSKNRTAGDFASALDSIWSIFAAAGCRRTPKADLIRMDIVQKVYSEEDPTIPKSDFAHFSRPGSAYAMRSQPMQGIDTRRDMAAASGDVLAGISEEPATNSRGPSLQIWRH